MVHFTALNDAQLTCSKNPFFNLKQATSYKALQFQTNVMSRLANYRNVCHRQKASWQAMARENLYFKSQFQMAAEIH